MATQAEIYRYKALECERLASTTHDSEIKRKLLELASQWHETADRQGKKAWIKTGY